MLKKYQKMMKDSKILIIGFFICVLLGLFFWYGQTPPKIDKIDTVFSTRIDTVYRDTTITIKEPVPKEVIKTRVDTFYTKEGNDTVFSTENKIYNDTLCQQNDTAIVTSYISGINANLDSTKIKLKTSKEIITNTIEITKYINKKKTFFDKFHIGIQAGYGYGFKSKQLEPYIGIGGSIDL